MTTDTEMKDADAPKPEGEAEQKKGEASKAPVLEDVLEANLKLISKAVATREARLLFGRLLRQTATVRSQFGDQKLLEFAGSSLGQDSKVLAFVRSLLGEDGQAMDTDSLEAIAPKEPFVSPAQPEEELYCLFLVCQLLTDEKKFDKLLLVTSASVAFVAAFNRRTLDVLAARVYFYHSLAHEKHDRLQDVRSTLLELHCTSVLRHDEYGQEILLNLLLRNYLHYNLYDQAEKLRAQAARPEATRSNQQYCRYLYYLGRIRAVQLEYTEAKECLLQAARKAPIVAKGFTVSVNKWLMVIRLLLGEVPERVEFQQQGMEGALRPYLELTHAVRSGDVKAFNKVAQHCHAVFLADKTHNLINRLRYNVIRAGLRRISVAYSRISLKDVAAKLGLPSVKDTESVVAKTIRDGSISAVLDHENHYLMSKEIRDIYITNEPQQAFHARTAFCMDIHNEAVKAMRYDNPETKPDGPAETTGAIEEAIAAALADDEDDF